MIGWDLDLGAPAGLHFIMGASNSTKEVRMKVKEAMHKGVDWVGPENPCYRTRKLDVQTEHRRHPDR